MSRRTSLRGLRVVLGLVAAATLVHAGPASAQGTGTSSLGGYQGIAQADGLHTFYNPQGLLPIAAPLDLGAPDAYVTIASGPATYARASAAYPGDLLANPDALLQTGVSGWKPGTIPAYPFVAIASSGTQADGESSPGPGLDARAHADDIGSSATAIMPATAAPGIATFGTMSSEATTTTDGSTVTVHGHTEISNLNVLGLVTVGSIVTDLTATSDGSTTSTSGGTVISDAAVLGTPVEIDAGGVKAAPGATTTTSPLGGLLGSLITPAVGTVNDVLANAGIHITLAGPVQSGDEKAGLLMSSGLRIDFELSDQTFPALKTLLDLIPFIENPVPGAPSIGDIITVAEARHLVSFELARGMVSLTARPSQPFVPAATPPASTSGASPAATGATSTATRSSPSVAVPSIAAAAPAATPLGGQPSVPIGAGIGALVLLALLAQPFAGEGLARWTNGMLADDQVACPWEER